VEELTGVKEILSKYMALLGLLLLALGTILYSVRYPGTGLVLGSFAAGGVAIVVTLVMNIRTVTAFTKKRSARHGVNSLLVTIFFTAILVVVQAISVRNTHRYDVTRNKRFTLAEQTVSLLSRLDVDVTITGFFRKNSSPRVYAEDVFSLYEHQSGHVRFELVDPDQQPHRADQMRAGYGDVVVEYGNNRRVFNGLDEEKLTNAIMLVTRKEQKRIYFTKGHYEKSLQNRDRGGYTMVKRGLEQEGYLVHDLSLVDVDRIPADCEVLVVAGPKKQYLKSEADKISAYLDGGGNAAFFLDPRSSLPHLEQILGGYRVAMDNVALLDELVIVDAGEEIFDATVTKIRRYERHAITRDFRVITLFPMARPVRIVSEDQELDVAAQHLALTEKSAWGETDLNSFRVGQATRDSTDVQGPLSVALVAEKSFGPNAASSSRIVVIGDSDFITNSFYNVLGNGDLFLNTMNYLAEEEDLIPIRAKRGLGDRIFITANQGRLVFLLCLILLPLSVIGTGTYVFLKKRKA
jgi:ABC-type uncharacterized transport system involved in gliding motility auxiliary subunit